MTDMLGTEPAQNEIAPETCTPVQHEEFSEIPLPLAGAELESASCAQGEFAPMPAPASETEVPEESIAASTTEQEAPKEITRLERVSVGAALKNGLAYLLADGFVSLIEIFAQILMTFVFMVGIEVLVQRGEISIAGAQDLDSLLVYALFGAQLLALGITLPWWRYLAPSSFSSARRRPLAGNKAARIASIVLMGIGFQMVISLVLTVVLPFFPELSAEYDQAIDSVGGNDFTLIAVLATVVGAPLSEEIACRGLMLEFALRAFCPEWKPVWRERAACRKARLPLPQAFKMDVPAVRFWIANAIQALIFGMLHGNLVQSSYAAIMGLLAGWIFWRTGKLRYNIGLHLVLNFSSFFVGGISLVCGLAGPAVEIALYLAFLVGGIYLFVHSTRPSAPAQVTSPAQ